MAGATWTLGEMRRQGHRLWSSCPERLAMLNLDLGRLIADLGEDFDVTGGALEARVACPCGQPGHRPHIGVDYEVGPRGGPGGAHNHGAAVPFDESVKLEVARRRQALATDPREQARAEQLREDLEKIRERKRRRRARNPYDFS